MSRVGENIKKIRLESGLSIKVLAKKLGVAESFINELEAGRRVANEGLIDRVSKVLGRNINDIGMSGEEESTSYVEERSSLSFKKETKPEKQEEVQDVWSSAFSSVIKQVPVYNNDLKKVLSTKLLPLQNNKIEGFAQDKVFFLLIEDDEMIGFRIAKGDIAFAHQISELESNSVCLIEYNSERIIRQIKRLDNNKVLLISNRGSMRTETANIKEIKAIAKLESVEIKL